MNGSKRYDQIAKLLTRALELWMLTCGMKTGDDWVPLLILEAQQKAAAKAKEANTDKAVKNPKSSAVRIPLQREAEFANACLARARQICSDGSGYFEVFCETNPLSADVATSIRGNALNTGWGKP